VTSYKIVSFRLFFGAVHDSSTPCAISLFPGISPISGRAGIIKFIEIAIKSRRCDPKTAESELR
jgi:hypothetical protein